MKSNRIYSIIGMLTVSIPIVLFMKFNQQTTIFNLIKWYSFFYAFVFLFFYWGNTILYKSITKTAIAIKSKLPPELKTSFNPDISKMKKSPRRLFLAEVIGLILLLFIGYRFFRETNFNAGIGYSIVIVILIFNIIRSHSIQKNLISKSSEIAEKLSEIIN